MWNIDVENVGGIKSGKTTLNQGPNIIQASNFQGKSSFLAALQTVMGTTGQFGEEHPLMETEDEGTVTLETEDSTYTVTLDRSVGVDSDVISRSGTPYLTDDQDRVAARLFAFLGEDNPIRAAVREKDQKRLTELLKAPLETENIDLRIKSLKSKVKDLEEELNEAETAAEKLPPAQEEVTQLENELEELKEKRDELEEKVDEDTEQKDLRDDLTGKQSDLEDKKSKLDRLENQIGRRENQLEKKEEELDNLEIPDEVELDTDIAEKEERVEELELKIDLLEDLYRSNKAVLDENELDLVTEIDRGISGDTLSCFVCGSDTSRETIEEQLRAIKEKQRELEEEKTSLASEIDDIQSRKKKIKDSKQRKSDLEDTIKGLKVNIREDENEVEAVEEEIAELEEEVEKLEVEYEEAEDQEEEYSSELTSVQQEIGTTRSDLTHAEDRLERLEEEADNRSEIQEELDEKKEELKELRARKDRKYQELVDQFKTAMADILEEFSPGFGGARLDKKVMQNDTTEFELSIARGSKTGDLDNLSEGERELVGIVMALAGYRTFNVDERVPCILLDGIGQLAAEHIEKMIEYLQDNTEILVTTAYPEAGSFDGTTISPDEWDVVSREEAASA